MKQVFSLLDWLYCLNPKYKVIYRMNKKIRDCFFLIILNHIFYLYDASFNSIE